MSSLSTEKKIRKIIPLERMLRNSPYSIVSMVVKIKGSLIEDNLRNAIRKVQQKHLLLQAGIAVDAENIPWFIQAENQELSVSFLERKSKDQWIQIISDSSKIPFDFKSTPPIRFILLHSSNESDLIILCHHVICDGMSLAYLARDIMTNLGNSELINEILSVPSLNGKVIPSDVKLKGILKFFMNLYNKQWDKQPIYFDFSDYERLNEAYWKNFTHNILSLELSESQTTELVLKCRKEQVTVNSALATAFIAGQSILLGKDEFIPDIGIGANLREYLTEPIKDAMGFYAGMVTSKFNYKPNDSFWENCRRFHKKIKSKYSSTSLLQQVLLFDELNPAIMETRDFKTIGKFLSSDSTQDDRIRKFSERKDVVLKILKMSKNDSVDRLYLGTAVTNLGRLDFPRKFGDLEIERLIMHPGGGFPLSTVNLVIGAVSCSGKLSILIEHSEERINTKMIEKIKEQAINFLELT